MIVRRGRLYMSIIDDIKYIVIDVDGVMTDAGIYYDNNGNEQKKFCTRDAAGFWALKKAGIVIIVITGRECDATLRRMTELGITSLYQNIKDKKSFLSTYMEKHKIGKNNIAYIGDDLNDYSSMQLCGFISAPKDACAEIKEIADYISPIKGGSGVVRDVAEYILKGKGLWKKMITGIYGIGI